PKPVRRFGLDDFAFAGNRPAQERRIHDVSAEKSDDRPEDPAESELAQRFGFHDKRLANPSQAQIIDRNHGGKLMRSASAARSVDFFSTVAFGRRASAN